MSTICQALTTHMNYVQDYLLKIVRRLLKIGQKEVKKRQNQNKISPFSILRT